MAYSGITLTTNSSLTSASHKYKLALSNNLTLRNSLVSLTHCSLYYTWRNIKASYNNNELSYKHIKSNRTHHITIPDGSYSILDINYFIRFTMVQNAYTKGDEDNSGINIYANPVFNRVTVSVNDEFELSFRTRLADFLGFDQAQLPITNTEIHGAFKPSTERVHNVVINCNLAENNYDYTSNALYTFTPDQSVGTLLSVRPYYPIWTSCRNASFDFIEVCFIDQDNRLLKIENNVTITLHIKDIN